MAVSKSEPVEANVAMPAVGDVIAERYILESIIGSGGAGVVYAARHVELGHRVAIKVVRAAGAVASERMLREARNCARLRSDHIVRAHDFGCLAGNLPFLIMEHLQGEDLARVLTRGPLSVETTVNYARQICAALFEAHAAGMIHRDLKPANIFVTTRPDGEPLVKVLDFGLSKIVEGSSEEILEGLTSTDAVMGSPRYMSPEQVYADKSLDARTDVWSLGVVLYELLANRVPFDADSCMAIAVRIATAPPTPLGAVVPEVPPALQAVVTRCLEKNPRDRYPSIAALSDALSHLEEPLEVPVAYMHESVGDELVTTSRSRLIRRTRSSVPRVALLSSIVGVVLGGTGLLSGGTFLLLMRREGALTASGAPVDRAPLMPANWSLAGSAPEYYQAGLDETVRLEDRATGYIKSTVADSVPPGFGTLAQTLDVKNLRGQRIRISSHVRAQGVKASAEIWMRVDGEPEKTHGYPRIHSTPIRGTTDWTVFMLVLDIPAESDAIVYGVSLSGVGQVWSDTLKLELVDTSVPTSE